MNNFSQYLTLKNILMGDFYCFNILKGVKNGI
jgi:hypothetical protein